MAYADAVRREADFLASSGDGFPSLAAADGGPWDIVQAYWPRTWQARKSGIYVQRPSTAETRFANHRKIQTHHFLLKLYWPVGGTTTAAGLVETEQGAFDDAIELLLTRIRGGMQDHTHGGRFMSVAEAPTPGRITVQQSDPEQTLTASPACLRATVTYEADDRDFTA